MAKYRNVATRHCCIPASDFAWITGSPAAAGIMMHCCKMNAIITSWNSRRSSSCSWVWYRDRLPSCPPQSVKQTNIWWKTVDYEMTLHTKQHLSSQSKKTAQSTEVLANWRCFKFMWWPLWHYYVLCPLSSSWGWSTGPSVHLGSCWQNPARHNILHT